MTSLLDSLRALAEYDQQRNPMPKRKITAALIRLGTALKNRVHHVLRPLDDDDKDAARALAASLLVAARDGISAEEEDAIRELWAAFAEARSNTP